MEGSRDDQPVSKTRIHSHFPFGVEKIDFLLSLGKIELTGRINIEYYVIER